MRSFIFSLAVALALPSVVSAASPRPWLALNGSWGTYSMSDVNADIRNVNASLAGSGLAMDEVNHGLGFGVTVGVEIPSRVSLGLGYERLGASSEVGDASGSLQYKLPANVVRGMVEYRFPTEQAFAPSVGFGLGLVKEAGAIEITQTGAGAAAFDLHGSGPLLETIVGGDWWATPQFALTGSAGYRYAKVREIKVLGQTAVNPDGSKYTVDYSGVVVRLGCKAAFAR